MKKQTLPTGLRVYASSLVDHDYATKLLPRLLDLPESALTSSIQAHKDAVKAIKEAEIALAAARRKASAIAEKIFLAAVGNWSIKEIQQATGYDDE